MRGRVHYVYNIIYFYAGTYLYFILKKSVITLKIKYIICRERIGCIGTYYNTRDVQDEQNYIHSRAYIHILSHSKCVTQKIFILLYRLCIIYVEKQGFRYFPKCIFIESVFQVDLNILKSFCYCSMLLDSLNFIQNISINIKLERTLNLYNIIPLT